MLLVLIELPQLESLSIDLVLGDALLIPHQRRLYLSDHADATVRDKLRFELPCHQRHLLLRLLLFYRDKLIEDGVPE